MLLLLPIFYPYTINFIGLSVFHIAFIQQNIWQTIPWFTKHRRRRCRRRRIWSHCFKCPYRHRRWFSFHCRFRVLVAFECGMFGYCCVSLLNACLTTRQTGSYRLPHYHSSQHPLFLNMTHCVHRLALGVVVLSDYFFSPPLLLSPSISLFYPSSFACLYVHFSGPLTFIRAGFCKRAPHSIGHPCPIHIEQCEYYYYSTGHSVSAVCEAVTSLN